ncbi:MAG: tRNA uridine-5-carboxymethylaminomethyl(34) synthesis GTPase MnmE [Gammaproteobacteria bacterium]|nr:tRNA uridine-5-carboxymethylaminomethyl(34) synthesis GTPase MnmE [Gammaproteobacteria bacterium]MCW8924580.1 tRNA uridine-5-carboxymethylaminomethyl(34) synthesis GTPase MnmE [Gammaproteobacteria bacterium]
MSDKDTIAAIATAPGQGGVGIVRVSGKKATEIAEQLTGKKLTPRYAHYTPFLDENNETIDNGLALFFENPNSFTGEDVLELQGHGGPVILDILLQRVLSLGARPARAGEFSERAFLNDKIDLTQAEAIADLIAAESHEAARAAVHSLNGEFSEEIDKLVEQLTQLRIHIEAALDFPEEEIDFLADKVIENKLIEVTEKLQQVKASAKQGRLLKEGMTVVIAGRPNAGKSSLLNQLAGQDTAIVTDIPGTTRDILREHIQIDGLPLHIIDTAGLRESEDVVEQEGIRRAMQEIEKADRLLYVMDGDSKGEEKNIVDSFSKDLGITFVHNKIDKNKAVPQLVELENNTTDIFLSAKTGAGIELLKQHLKKCMGYENRLEGKYMARRRHLEAIEQAEQNLELADLNLKHKQGELVAEELSQAQNQLASITGEFSSDDLLGRIFSDFCIGK